MLLTINSAKSQERYTQDQMGYYRGVVLPLLAEEWGWADHAELHFRLKEKLLPPIIPINQWPWRKLGRDEIKEPPSMADMNVEQTSAYLQAVIDLAVEMGVEVPEPRRSGKP